MDNILEVRNLKKTIEENKFSICIDSLDIPKGAIVGLIGENGAPADSSLLIGTKSNFTGYEALVLRENIPVLGNVAVRTPNYEDLLVHTIIQNRKNHK